MKPHRRLRVVEQPAEQIRDALTRRVRRPTHLDAGQPDHHAAGNRNPAFIQLRTLEVETTRTRRWDGKHPLYYMGGGSMSGGPNLALVPLRSH